MSGQLIYNSQNGQGWEGRPRISVCTSPSELLIRHLVEISNRLWASGAGLSEVDRVGCDVSHGQGEVGPRKES